MINPRIFIGVDPGGSGAMCAICLSDDEPVKVEFINHKGTSNLELFNWLKMVKDYNVIMACLEHVHSLIGMSAKSNFSFGGAFYTVKALIEINELGLTLVQPKAWQKKVGVITPAKIKGKERAKHIKNQVAQLCKQIYPTAVIHGPKGGLLDGRSDALMIAHYCRLTYT